MAESTDSTGPTGMAPPTATPADTAPPVTRRADTIAPTTPPSDAATVIAPDAQVRVRARTSITATLALVLGLSGLYAALSGRLAPIGLALCVVGALVAFGGLHSSRPAVADRRAIARAASGRRISTSAVAGGGLSTFALVISLAGVVIAILALNHTSSWLDSDADQVARARDWLNARWSWLGRW